MSSISDDDQLRMKESKFEAFVEFASKSYGLKYKPRVVFKDGHFLDNPRANAYIEIFSQIIYVSRAFLINATDAEIKETAFHEVTHLLNASHDPAFYNQLGDAITGTWQPPPGVIAIDGGRRVKKPQKKPKLEVDKEFCNYHLCRKKAELVQCMHCGKYYCNEHIKPAVPSFPNFKNTKKFIIWKKNKNCHPCPDYYSFVVKKDKEQKIRYSKALDRMSRKGNSIKINGQEKRIIKISDLEIKSELPIPDEANQKEKPDKKIKKIPSPKKEEGKLITQNDEQKLEDELKEDIVMKIAFFGYLARNATVELVKINKN